MNFFSNSVALNHTISASERQWNEKLIREMQKYFHSTINELKFFIQKEKKHSVFCSSNVQELDARLFQPMLDIYEMNTEKVQFANKTNVNGCAVWWNAYKKNKISNSLFSFDLSFCVFLFTLFMRHLFHQHYFAALRKLIDGARLICFRTSCLTASTWLLVIRFHRM